MSNCRAAAWVLRLSQAKRKASVLNASSYLGRLTGGGPLDFAAMREEIYVLLLSSLARPPHTLYIKLVPLRSHFKNILEGIISKSYHT
jgi:hypothetical protein